MLGATLQSLHIKDSLPERLAAKTAAPRRRYRPDVDMRRRRRGRGPLLESRRQIFVELDRSLMTPVPWGSRIHPNVGLHTKASRVV